MSAMIMAAQTGNSAILNILPEHPYTDFEISLDNLPTLNLNFETSESTAGFPLVAGAYRKEHNQSL